MSEVISFIIVNYKDNLVILNDEGTKPRSFTKSLLASCILSVLVVQLVNSVSSEEVCCDATTMLNWNFVAGNIKMTAIKKACAFHKIAF